MIFRDAFRPIRALRSAFRLLSRAPALILVGGILVAVTAPNSCGGIQIDDGDVREVGRIVESGGVADAFADAREVWYVLAAGLGAVALVFVLLAWILNGLFKVGFARGVERVARTGEARLGDLFQSHGALVSIVVARLVRYVVLGLALILTVGVAAGITAAVAVLSGGPGALVGFLLVPAGLLAWFYVALGLLLVDQAVALEALPPLDALRRSWEIADGNRLRLFWFGSTQLVILAVGAACTCLVGLLVLAPLYHTAWIEAYLRVIGHEEEQEWWLTASA